MMIKSNYSCLLPLLVLLQAASSVHASGRIYDTRAHSSIHEESDTSRSTLTTPPAMVNAMQYNMVQINFTAPQSCITPNPFMAEAVATFTLRQGVDDKVGTSSTGSNVVPLFYAGNNTFAVRFACPVVGSWAWSVASDDLICLNGKVGQLQCTPNTNANIHGGLRVNPDHRHHFVYEDGHPYFMMAYECDWLWALGLEADSTTQSLDEMLDTISHGQFNQVLLNVYANFSEWAERVPRPPRIAPTRITPWIVLANRSIDHSHLDLAFWNYYDHVIATLQARGIVAHIMITVWNKNVTWPALQSKEDDLFWRTVIARYQAYSNVIWDVSKEAWHQEDAYWTTRFELIQSLDGHRRLTTMHSLKDQQQTLKHKYCDMISDQQHGNYTSHILESRNNYSMPIANVEFQYEMGPVLTYNVQSPADDMRVNLWSIYMSGGYATWYYGPTAWDVILPNMIPPGYTYTANLVQFFTKQAYTELVPVPSFNSSQGLLMEHINNTGNLVVYMKAAIVSVPVPCSDQPYMVRYYDPRSGQYRPDIAQRAQSSPCQLNLSAPLNFCAASECVAAILPPTSVKQRAAAKPVGEDGQVNVTVDLENAMFTTDQRFVSVTIDASLATHPAYDLNTTDPAWKVLAKGLSPAYCRIGGTRADFTTYNVTSDKTTRFASSQRDKLNNNIVLNGSTLSAAMDFAREAGWDIVFGLNDQAGFNATSSHLWQPDNAEQLMSFVVSQGLHNNIVGYELGNEPNLFNDGKNISSTLLAQDYDVFLNKALPKIYNKTGKGTAQSPFAMGPDVTPGAFNPSKAEPSGFFYNILQLLQNNKLYLDVLTWHHYYDHNTNYSELIKPETLDTVLLNAYQANNQSKPYRIAARKAGHNAPQLWLGETGGPLKLGGSQIPDTFATVLWTWDKLAIAAMTGNSVVARQQFSILLGRLGPSKPPIPSAGYWALYIWKRIVGNRVLGVANATELMRDVRVYAHCATDNKSQPRRHVSPDIGDDGRNGGAVVLIVVNLRLEEVHLNPFGTDASPNQFAKSSRTEYHITGFPDEMDLGSASIAVNGEELTFDGSELPDIKGQQVPSGGSLPARIQPLSAALIVYNDVAAMACSM